MVQAVESFLVFQLEVHFWMVEQQLDHLLVVCHDLCEQWCVSILVLEGGEINAVWAM